jgi:Putative methyltransferase
MRQPPPLMVLSLVVCRRYAHGLITTKRSMVLNHYPGGAMILRLSSTNATPTTATARIEQEEVEEEQQEESIDEVEQINTSLSSSSSAPPWTDPSIRLKTNPRFRQHVNPLANKFQLPAELPADWPASVYEDCTKPLHLDIGCGKGGYLWKLSEQDISYNYLGLELRPAVATFAKQRYLNRGGGSSSSNQRRGSLDYIGCNANVDLGRILSLYQPGVLERVTIQFPDPHFKVRRQPTMGAVSRGSHTDFCSPVEKCQEKSRHERTHSPTCPIHHARRRTDLSPERCQRYVEGKKRCIGMENSSSMRSFSPLCRGTRLHAVQV